MSSVKWVKELPPFATNRGRHLPVEALDERPGQWAVLREYKSRQTAYPVATRLRHRLGRTYEFAVRVNGTGYGSILYGRRLRVPGGTARE